MTNSDGSKSLVDQVLMAFEGFPISVLPVEGALVASLDETDGKMAELYGGLQRGIGETAITLIGSGILEDKL